MFHTFLNRAFFPFLLSSLSLYIYTCVCVGARVRQYCVSYSTIYEENFKGNINNVDTSTQLENIWNARDQNYFIFFMEIEN